MKAKVEAPSKTESIVLVCNKLALFLAKDSFASIKLLAKLLETQIITNFGVFIASPNKESIIQEESKESI